MKLEYITSDKNMIRATLEDGETLGNCTGPIVVFVPTDPGNREFAEITEKGIHVE